MVVKLPPNNLFFLQKSRVFSPEELKPQPTIRKRSKVGWSSVICWLLVIGYLLVIGQRLFVGYWSAVICWLLVIGYLLVIGHWLVVGYWSSVRRNDEDIPFFWTKIF